MGARPQLPADACLPQRAASALRPSRRAAARRRRHLVELYADRRAEGRRRRPPLPARLSLKRRRGDRQADQHGHRVSRQRAVATLDQLPKAAHCSSCNIAYDADFARNVELSFQPSPTVRELTIGEYCLNGPHTTPHVVMQQILAPGEERTVGAALAPGPYRLRTIERGGQVDIDHRAGEEIPSIAVDGGTITAGPPSPRGEIRMSNRGARDTGIVIESREWVADALTAHRATSMQAFRDLMPGAALRPGQGIAIDNVTLMFTDLAGSTALYERVGDGPAYRLGRAHFALLARTRPPHNTTPVKTIRAP